ncbi:MAG: amino acid adenylation domain-containing protein [Synechococcales cyanobacterium CRU_2_2]|nr:amino acid adenylation domain-containing protein [Synechococcales cyanobacterium CRU_2_2]
MQLENNLPSDDRCINQLFESQVARQPEQIAIVWANRSLSYGQLNDQANCLAHYLRSLGAVPDALIGVYLDRSVELVVTLLGILKAGAAYVPLDRNATEEQLSEAVSNVQLDLIVSESDLATQLPINCRTVLLDRDAAILAQQPTANPLSGVTPDNLLAYLLYSFELDTSTKGVALEHQNLLALLDEAQQTLPVASGSGAWAATALSNPFSAFEIFAPLAWGGTLLLAEKVLNLADVSLADSNLADLDLAEFSSDWPVTLLNASPSVVDALLARNALPESIQVINLVGETLPPSLLNRLQQLQPARVILSNLRLVDQALDLAVIQTPSSEIRPEEKFAVDVSLLNAAERQQLQTWNETQVKDERLNWCMHELVEAQVARSPQQIALVFEDQSLTYQAMNEQANRLARRLRGLGVGPESLVGICLERSPDLIIALLAILKAGGGYLPLDISYPADRLQYMMENAQIQVLLTQRHLAQKLLSQSAQVICLDGQRAEDAGFDAGFDAGLDAGQDTANLGNNLDNLATPDNLGYVIYTSGSTGQPKGVAMPQRALVNMILWQMDQSAAFAPGGRTLQFTPISFDVSCQEIFSTLAEGSTLVLISDEQRRDPLFLLRYLKEAQIQRLFLPFVALRQLAEAYAQAGILPEHLRQVITAGEQLRITAELAHWFTDMPDCTLHNHYGPSESHVVTACSLEGAPQDWPVLPPIGRAIANTQLYILNSEMQALPLGKTGELYLAGDCLARGYLNRPEITAQRFIQHRFAGRTTVLYQTGDLARYLPDGSLEYLGRGDQQVKIRGFRIEPGEIEALLEQHAQVQEAVVLTREATPGDARLVAYVLAHAAPVDTEIPLARQLRHFVSAKLPDYMVPSAFVILDVFPLTPSGKVDRRALPIPEWTRTEEGEYVAPRTPVETQLSGLWAELLGVEKISVHDTFFSLGGHSILAVQLTYLIQERFEVEVELGQFLKNSTIAGLAELVEQMLTQGRACCGGEDGTTAAKGRLDEVIRAPENPSEAVKHYFLTGATGFLGVYLLHDLLRQTRADIYCLVRATSPTEGLARIKKSLMRYQLWNEGDSDRIIPITGSLSLPRLGIAPRVFDRLAEKLDAIYHCGSWVNIIYPYSVLEAANVTGTQEVLRLASQSRTTPVHYVSTVDVFPSGEGLRHLSEDAPTGPAQSLFSGYAKSKYIAESLIQEAQARNIPMMIYRPSNIMGDSRRGICPESSFISQMIMGCVQMGLAPKIDAALNIVPVDYVSQAIVQLSRTELPMGQAFNVVNPGSYAWNDLVRWMGDRAGYAIQLVSYETWCAEVLWAVSQDPEHNLFFLTTFLTNLPFIRKSLGGFYFETQQLESAFARMSLHCPTVGDDLLQLYCASLVEQGLIPAAVNPGVAQSLATGLADRRDERSLQLSQAEPNPAVGVNP